MWRRIKPSSYLSANDIHLEGSLLLQDAAVVRPPADEKTLNPNKCEGWPLIVDTGSIVSLIPERAAVFLGLNVATSSKLTLFLTDGRTFTCSPIYIKIWHGDFGYSCLIKAGIMDRSNILLGRDALSSLLVIYDGKHSRFCLRKRRRMDHLVLALLRRF
jgi:hypothetical protein